eukprot:242343_1
MSSVHLILLLSMLCVISKIQSTQILNQVLTESSCGLLQDCHIVCNEQGGCLGATFYVYDHQIHIECLASYSCQEVNIIASNVTLLNLTISGDYGFTEGSITIVNASSVFIECNGTRSCQSSEVFFTNSTLLQFKINGVGGFNKGYFVADKNSQQIKVECIGSLSCDESIFYYHGQQMAEHHCFSGMYFASCQNTLIYAQGPIAIHCMNAFDLACHDLKVLFPHNSAYHQLSYINISNPSNTMWTSGHMTVMTLFSVFHRTPTIQYFNGTLHEELDRIKGRIWIYYGYKFDVSCDLTDLECVNDTEQMEDEHVFILDTESSDIVNDLNFSAHDTNDSNLLVIVSDQFHNKLCAFTPPIMNDQYLSIFCIFCNSVTFKLHQLYNTVITYASDKALYNSTIQAPQNHFTLNGFGANTELNTYFLNNTKSITINNIDGGTVYVANQTNVRIYCDFLHSCRDSIVISSLDPISFPIYGKWDIVFHTTQSDPHFRLYFPRIHRLCRFVYTSDFSSCPFLTQTPTRAPTNPSHLPTKYPTFEPTIEPTFNPTNNPTIIPSYDPTLEPTDTPTTTPTHYPTNTTQNPTIYTTSHKNIPSNTLMPCENDCKYFTHVVFLYFDIIFDANTHNESMLFKLCNTFFSTINATEYTLMRMDGIIMEVLNILKAINPFEVSQILQYPYTALLTGMINCDYNFRIVHTTIVTAIESGIDNKKEFDKLFDDRSLFINETHRLLSQLFQVDIDLRNSVFKHKPSRFIVVLWCLSVTLLVICIVISAYLWHSNRNARFVQNMLVLIIGITSFDDPDLNLEEDEHNIRKLMELWGEKYNYTVRVCNNAQKDHSQLTLNCTKKDVIHFINKNTADINDFDGVIVHIFSHGQNDSFRTSNGKYVKLAFIKRKLNGGDSDIRIIFYHPCRGQASHHIEDDTSVQNSRFMCCKCRKHPSNSHVGNAESGRTLNHSQETNESQINDPSLHTNFVCIFGNVSDRTTSTKGYFTNSIYVIFDSNANKRCILMKPSFDELLRALRSELIERSSKAEICCTEGVAMPIKFKVNKNAPRSENKELHTMTVAEMSPLNTT